MKISYFNVLTGGFIITFLIMIASVYFSIKNADEFLYNNKLVDHTHLVMENIQTFGWDLSKAEGDIRGYYVSRSMGFYENYIRDTVRMIDAIKSIKLLTSDNPIQQNNLSMMLDLVHARIHNMNLLYQFAARGESDSVVLKSRAQRANELTNKIYKLSNQMIDVEKDLLKFRQIKVADNLERSKDYIFYSGIASLVLGFFFIVFIRRDIIRRKEIESELRNLNENKDKFFSIISHDLRGPTYAAQQISEILTDKSFELKDDERMEMKKMMRQSMKRVTSLLDDLLEWSRFQMKSIEFNPEIINTKNIAGDVIDSFRSLFVNKKIRVYNLQRDDCNVYGDKYMISTIVRNLISNAIKFTKENKNIYITCNPNENGFVEISVRDEGVGMSDNVKENLFKVGVRQSSKGTAQETGTGLGLILCKEFVEKQGGAIWVETQEGKGSTFTFTLPLNNDKKYKTGQRESVKRSILRWFRGKKVK